MKEEMRTAICAAVVEVRREGREEAEEAVSVKCFFLDYTVDLSDL